MEDLCLYLALETGTQSLGEGLFGGKQLID